MMDKYSGSFVKTIFSSFLSEPIYRSNVGVIPAPQAASLAAS